jgi:hypothetical protein
MTSGVESTVFNVPFKEETMLSGVPAGAMSKAVANQGETFHRQSLHERVACDKLRRSFRPCGFRAAGQ